MDQHSTLDHNSALPAMEGDTPGTSASRSATASVSAGIAEASAHPQSAEPAPRFAGEDGGRSSSLPLSLAEMAHLDLDAALQLLAERAQYITGASGAAIALRRGEHNDMLCRASAGSNAPELGALLSMEYGLSGESVRTRQTLRCDDAESDPRVNREGCRQLGIASVVVMPIVSEEQVLGVFELFSGQPRAFEPRDFSALQRLSEMVETAVKHAAAAQAVPEVREPTVAQPQPEIAAGAARAESSASVTVAASAPAPTVKDIPANDLFQNAPPPVPPEPVKAILEKPRPEKADMAMEKTGPEPELAPKKALFWSAAMQAPSTAAAAESIAVPPVLRSLQKCQACGFPVSQGRTFCVECEEKQWRGQRLPVPDKEAAGGAVAPTVPTVAASAPLEKLTSAPRPAAITPPPSVASSSDVPVSDVPARAVPSENSTLFLGSATPQESWLSANKYILGALLVVAIVLGVIAWLR
jgi:hypothetical protein